MAGRIFATFAVALVATGAAASAGFAYEAHTTNPLGAFQPVAPGGVQTNSPDIGTRQCRAGWQTIQAAPSGFVIGNCPGGTQFNNYETATGDGMLYHGGYFTSSAFAGCGWINDNAQFNVNSSSNSNCQNPNPSRPNTDFMAPYSPNPHDGLANDGCWSIYGACGGTTITPVAPCPEYANFRPWLPGQTPTGLLRTRPAGYTHIHWRYDAKYASAQNVAYDMVYDNGSDSPAGSGTWVFVPGSCLNFPVQASTKYGGTRTYG